MAIGGSPEDISLAGRTFPFTADADPNIKIGGFENEVQSNGDGSARIIKTRVPLQASDCQVEVDNDRGDLEYLQSIADGKQYVPVALTLADGNTWQGTAIITSELQASAQSASATFSIMGQGKLTQQ